MSSFKTPVVNVDPADPDMTIIACAAKIIRDGGLVVFPTETVYGIAANALNEKTIIRLREVKGQRGDKPFTVHISHRDMVSDMGGEMTAKIETLMKRYWPGPITIILKTAGGISTGFRMPAHKVALALIAEAGVPVVAPSANISGNRPPTDAMTALCELDGLVDLVINAGKTDVGVESTVIDMTAEPPRILRAGALTKIEIEKVIGNIGE